MAPLHAPRPAFVTPGDASYPTNSIDSTRNVAGCRRNRDRSLRGSAIAAIAIPHRNLQAASCSTADLSADTDGLRR